MIRYSKIKTGEQREIVLLRGRGCTWRQCTFCDYYLDGSDDESVCAADNSEALGRVTGEFGILEMICSGAFCDLHDGQLDDLRRLCLARKIHLLIVEAHWMHRDKFASFREFMAPVSVEFKAGVETFDVALRESWRKGLGNVTAAEIAEHFDHCNLLAGVRGLSAETTERDIETALRHFRRVCVNVFTGNSTDTQADCEAIASLQRNTFPRYANDPRVDILDQNTDFGVGGDDDE